MYVVRSLYIVSILIGLLVPMRSANAFFETTQPFIGIDFQERTLNFDENNGGNLFCDHAFQYDLYAGLRFCDYLGVDLGYFANKSQNRTSSFGPGDIVLGQTLAAGSPVETHFTETKIKGPHVDFLVFTPFMPEYGIELFGGIGVAYSKLMLKEAIIAINDITLTSPIARNYDIKRANARALLGLQTLVYSCVGIRGTVTWENTSVFNDLKPAEFPDDQGRVNVKNSWAYGLGVYATL